MALEVQASKRIDDDAAAQTLVELLTSEQGDLGLTGAIAYYGYPRYRDEDDELLSARVVLVSPEHGVLVFGTVNATSHGAADELVRADAQTETFFGQLYGKLVAIKNLRAGPRALRVNADAFLYSPFLEHDVEHEGALPLLRTSGDVREAITARAVASDPKAFDELVATIDGSRVLPRPKKREIAALPGNSKGAIVAKLEGELAKFDKKQREGSIADVNGPQRIRGLAGSGKTIILAKKAALNHLDNPDARIGYTFYTKSLYQQIRRLITRFYRDEHDRDPDWGKVQVMHAWGGSDPGIYSVACRAHGVAPIPFTEADRLGGGDPFNFVCKHLMESAVIKPMYDLLFIDEGQDYPMSFLQLCAQLSEKQRFVLAYDELQTIFRPKPPTQAEIFGVDKTGQPNVQFTKDIVLYKCYRNPLEILVCAHALGFGLYGNPVQMLENADHWSDIGYTVQAGDFQPGSNVVVFRPKENSLSVVSDGQNIDEIIVANAFDEYRQEISFVADGIAADIADGLRPDDIVVAVIDDRNARRYLIDIAAALAEKKIRTNNIHGAYGLVDFQQEGQVTLTTVHKAKGNEAFMVYVVGVDAVFQPPNKRNRNKLFTAITRAKAWVRVSGIGAEAAACVKEIHAAKANCPYLRFTYPSTVDLEMMDRDLGQEAIVDQKLQRMLDMLSVEQLAAYLEQRKAAKPAKGTGKANGRSGDPGVKKGGGKATGSKSGPVKS